MKRILLVSLAVLILAGCSGLGRGTTDHAQDAGRMLEGAWEHVHADSLEYRRVKILSAGHFIWATYQRGTGMLVAMGGGTFEFNGRVYIEKVRFASEDLRMDLVGGEHVFVAEVDGDTWRHSGTLSNGVQIRETWRRLE